MIYEMIILNDQSIIQNWEFRGNNSTSGLLSIDMEVGYLTIESNIFEDNKGENAVSMWISASQTLNTANFLIRNNVITNNQGDT